MKPFLIALILTGNVCSAQVCDSLTAQVIDRVTGDTTRLQQKARPFEPGQFGIYELLTRYILKKPPPILTGVAFIDHLLLNPDEPEPNQ